MMNIKKERKLWKQRYVEAVKGSRFLTKSIICNTFLREYITRVMRQVLSQLSYTPKSLFLSIANILFLPEYRINHKTMGLSGLEPPTSRERE